MKAIEIIRYLETIAPPQYQETYDNSGLIVGDPNTEVTGAIISLDTTEAVLQDAIDRGANMVISHHPIVFGGLKRLNGSNYVERVVIRAIQEGILIYAIHTNLDNVLQNGVNEMIAQKLGLIELEILKPKEVMVQCQIQCSSLLLDNLRDKMSAANISIKEVETDLGYLVFCTIPEHKLSTLRVICQGYRLNMDVIPTKKLSDTVGSGILGSFDLPLPEGAFLALVKEKMATGCIRHTELLKKSVSKVAICGGSGSFLLKDAIRSGADAFITGDFKYHQFFDADGRIVILDIGHYESEQFTAELLEKLIREKFPNFAARCTQVTTNPVKYYL